MNARKWVLSGLSTIVLCGLFVYLDGSPLSTLSANGTSVQISSLELAPNSDGTVEITAKGIPAGPGLSAYDLSVEFNPQVIQLREVRGGDSPFTSVVVTKVDNAAGRARLASFHTREPAPVGNALLARLDVSATGASGTQSPLSITVTTLSDFNGVNLAATPTDGVVSIQNQPSTQSNPQVAPTPVPTVASRGSSQSSSGSAVSALSPTPTPLPTQPTADGQGGGGGPGPTLAPESTIAPSVPEDSIASEIQETSTIPNGIPAAPLPSSDTVEVVPAPSQLAAEPSNTGDSPVPTDKAAELVEPGAGDGLSIWIWVLIGLAGITVLVWGGILYWHLRNRFLT